MRIDGHGTSSGARVRRATRTEHDDRRRPPTTATSGDHQRRTSGAPSVGGAGRRATAAARRAGAAVRTGRRPTRPRRRRGPAHADGTGPAGAGCGPYLVGGVALTSEPGVAEGGHVEPSAAVNASSSVRPSAYERMSVTSASLP